MGLWHLPGVSDASMSWDRSWDRGAAAVARDDSHWVAFDTLRLYSDRENALLMSCP